MTSGTRLDRSADTDPRLAEAMQLLAQRDSFETFERAAAMIEQAAQDGDAEATAMVATLEAIGAGRPQDWNRSFDHLELAAGRGSQLAREQLRLLARSSDGVDGSSPGDSPDDWSAFRRRIDLARLLSPPQHEVLANKPRIRVVRNFATPAECRWVIERTSPLLAPAMIWNEATGRGEVDPRRSSSAVDLRLAQMDVVLEVLRARISARTGLPVPIFEIPQVMHYSVGQEFVPHHDFLDPTKPGLSANVAHRGQRILTFIIYLNDDFDGGETEFPLAGISWRGSTGDALAFSNVTIDGQPDPMSLHAGRPPTHGEKWIFSQWVRDRAPRSGGNPQ
jgi:prolyl 4-hydroxylase